MIRCAVSDCAFQCELVVILIDNAKLAAVHGDQAIGLARSGLRDTEGVVETIKAALIKSDAAAESIVAGQNNRTVTVLNQRSVIKSIVDLILDGFCALLVVLLTPLLSIFFADNGIFDILHTGISLTELIDCRCIGAVRCGLHPGLIFNFACIESLLTDVVRPYVQVVNLVFELAQKLAGTEHAFIQVGRTPTVKNIRHTVFSSPTSEERAVRISMARRREKDVADLDSIHILIARH